MKAAVLVKPNTLEVRDIPMRTCQADEVLIKVHACGICGSDLRYYQGENPWALHTLGIVADNPPNIILGHEFAGEVVAAGSPQFAGLVGKRVFAEPYNTCGLCKYCRTGRYNLCRNTRHIGHGAGWSEMDYFPGGMAEYCPVWATHVYELPDNITDEEATFLDPLAVAIHAVNVSGLRPGTEVLVLGSGPVGLCIAQVAKAYGASRVHCTDIYEQALAIAAAVGIHDPIDSTRTNVLAHILEQTGHRGVDAVFDTVGTAETQEQALKMLACSGTLVNLVANTTRAAYRLIDLSGERCIRSSSNNLYEDVLTGIKLLQSGLIHVKPLITNRFALDDVEKGFRILLDKVHAGAVKAIIRP